MTSFLHFLVCKSNVQEPYPQVETQPCTTHMTDGVQIQVSLTFLVSLKILNETFTLTCSL